MPVTKPFAPAKIEADKVLVYVYRPESFIARGNTWSLKVDGKTVSTYFINNGYIPIYADVSSENIEIELYPKHLIDLPRYDAIVLTNVKAGQTYYVKAFMEFGGTPHFELMDKAVGQKEISSSLYFEDMMK